jgi:two-component system NtrC family response regulator
MTKILVIEDNKSLLTLVEMLLVSEGYEVFATETGVLGLELFESEAPDVVVTDIRLPDISGYDIFEKINAHSPDVPVIIFTAFGNVTDAVDAIKKGAFNYITKPFENDEFIANILKAVEFSNLKRANKALKHSNTDKVRPVIVGNSLELKNLLSLCEKVASTDAPVLITGASGTGKELVASFIHSGSAYADGAMFAINCGAIPEQLVESELFGHKKGAFTGADKNYEGRIIAARNGTLFLDEVGELPINVQAKLLRFLQVGEIDPVGANKSVKVKTRIIAATNRNLNDEIKKGNFREDLFYRLNVFPVEVPDLKERKEDIEPLANFFAKKYGYSSDLPQPVINKLKTYNWPGNIRELENVIYRLCILSGSEEANVDNLPTDITGDFGSCISMSLPDGEFDIEALYNNIIIKALNKFDGNKSKTAQYLKIPRHVLLYRLEKYNL